MLSNKATKFHCLPFATPIRGNLGFLGEPRLLDSSNNWPGAVLSYYVQRELLVMVGCSPEYFLPLVTRRCLASLTLAKPHPLLYIITTNRSSFCMWRDPRLKHASASSVSVSPGVFCQDAQAVFLPNPRKCDVVSHRVMAWKSDNATDLEGPRSEQISWMGISRSFFPLPKPTQRSTRPSVGKRPMARTTISLSTVLTYAVWCPCPDACAR